MLKIYSDIIAPSALAHHTIITFEERKTI